MFRPSLRSLTSLVVISVFAMALYIYSARSFKDVKSRWYDDKLKAAQLMQKCLDTLNNEVVRFANDETLSIEQRSDFLIDTTNDPNSTGLIGKAVSSITTSQGSLSERLTSLNPNMAAVMVDLLKKAGAKKGDPIAVGLTAANPGVNIAVYAAMQTLGVKPVIITSIGSSQFGANRELFTWLDMESSLFDNNLISFKSKYSSLGGGKDKGRGLSRTGRESLEATALRNNCPLFIKSNLQASIEHRLRLYEDERTKGRKYKMFVNLGAGQANVGSLVNAKLVRNGVSKHLAEQNFATPGTMMAFARNNIPIVHVYNVQKLAIKYGLPIDPEPLPAVGTGKVFTSKINNVTVAAVCLALILLVLIVVVYIDRKHRHFTRNIVTEEGM